MERAPLPATDRKLLDDDLTLHARLQTQVEALTALEKSSSRKAALTRFKSTPAP